MWLPVSKQKVFFPLSHSFGPISRMNSIIYRNVLCKVKYGNVCLIIVRAIFNRHLTKRTTEIKPLTFSGHEISRNLSDKKTSWSFSFFTFMHFSNVNFNSSSKMLNSVSNMKLSYFFWQWQIPKFGCF